MIDSNREIMESRTFFFITKPKLTHYQECFKDKKDAICDLPPIVYTTASDGSCI